MFPNSIVGTAVAAHRGFWRGPKIPMIARVMVGLLAYGAPAWAVTIKCDNVESAKSVGHSQEATVIFTNYLESEVQIYWINYQGKRVLYRKLAPGDSYRQQSFFTHVWLATNRDGNCVGLFLVDRQLDRFGIRTQPPPPPKSAAKKHNPTGNEPDLLAPGWRDGN